MPSSDIQDRDRLMLKDYSQDNWSVGSRDIKAQIALNRMSNCLLRFNLKLIL